MPGLLDGPPPGGDELRAIVDRAGRHRRRHLVAVAGAASLVALAAGGAIGWAATSGHHTSTTVSAGPDYSSTPSAQTGAVGGGPCIGTNGGPCGTSSTTLAGPGTDGTSSLGQASLTRIFVRQANGISVRGFRDIGSALTIAGCPVVYATEPQSFEAEVSSAGMVGTAFTSFIPEAAPAVRSLGVQELGTAEHSPTYVVIANVSSAATGVKVDFTGGASDEMAPVDGWVALVAPASGSSATVGTLQITGATGAVLSTQTLTTSTVSPGFAAPLVTPDCGCIAEPGDGGGASGSSGVSSRACLEGPGGATTVSPPAVTIPGAG